jgi:hypothetical protein
MKTFFLCAFNTKLRSFIAILFDAFLSVFASILLQLCPSGNFQFYVSVFRSDSYPFAVFFNDLLCGLVASVLATDPEIRVQLPALPNFLRSSVSGTGSTQPREYKWRATWKKK